MELPTVDLSFYLGSQESQGNECFKLKESLHKYGAVAIRDPRVREEDSEMFIDMLEKYFGQPKETKLKDCRPDVSYQVGVTPELTEWPRDNSKYIKGLKEENKPTPFDGPDKKWRFQWRIGARREYTKFPELLAEPVIPENFPEWKQVMDSWGQKLLDAVFTVSEMLSIGLGLGASTLPELIRFGTHLLSPTGSDLNLYGDKPGTVLAGFHYDISFLTIHGRSRFPGLYLWTSEGKRIPCKIPKGCLLVQSGAQLEYLTGGYIKKGYHEVIVSEETCRIVNEKRNRKESLWRVSSTMFTHLEPDKMLYPLIEISDAFLYPPVLAGFQVEEELKAVKLSVV